MLSHAIAATMSANGSSSPRVILAAIIVPAIWACGGGTMSGDAGDEGDTGDAPLDSGDAAGDGACTLDLEEVVATEQEALYEEEAGFWVWDGVIRGETVFPPVDIAQLEIWTGSGGPVEPGTYAIPGGSYAGCGLCVLVREGCRPEGGISRCERDYLAVSGSVEIEEVGVVGESLSGTISGATRTRSDAALDAADIDWDGGTFASAPVPGGAVWCLDSLEFSSDVAPYPVR